MYAYMYVCTFFILICIYLHVRMCSYVHTNVNKLFFYVPYLWKCILFRMQFCASRKHTYLNIFILAPVTKINMHAQNTYIHLKTLLQIHAFPKTQLNTHLHMYVCTYVCQYRRMFISIFINLHTYICIYVCLSFCLNETGKSALCSNYGHYSFTLVKYVYICMKIHTVYMFCLN